MKEVEVKTDVCDTISKIESDIMKIVTKNVDFPVSQYKIYNELCNNYNLKKSMDKDELKMHIIIVLRYLKNKYKNIVVLYKNTIFYVSYSDNKNILNENNLSLYKYEAFPSEKEVILYIVDKEIYEYYDVKDYDGNNILHSLVIYNEVEIINKNIHMFELFHLIYVKNDKNQFPVDLIDNILITNIFVKKILVDFTKLELDMNKLKFNIIDLENKNIDLTNELYNKINYNYFLLGLGIFIFFKIIF
jgi:hypothetical protein